MVVFFPVEVLLSINRKCSGMKSHFLGHRHHSHSWGGQWGQMGARPGCQPRMM